ncbi:hypothetical protein COCON_G00000510, partial [Conger conger]
MTHGAKFNLNDIVQFVCNTGYSLEGALKSHCQPNGQWSNALPSCKIVSCVDPGFVENSVRQVLSSGLQRFSFQSSVSYTCSPGYYSLGTTSLTCQGDGTWDRAQPKCLLVVCDQPGVPPHGQVSGDRRTVGSLVRYSCVAPHSLLGNATRMCQLNGLWSGAVPHCS